jgi:hypothetical protein
MPKQFHELRERLLNAGAAPRHVQRYLKELVDHLDDLRAEELRAGRGRVEAESAALDRLGSIDDLSKAMIEQRHFQSWCARAPWAAFGLAPLSFLAAAYFIACFILWLGWKLFLPGADTPFGAPLPIYSFQNIYFQIGRFIYYASPVLIGWVIGLVAARQRLSMAWPMLSLVLIAWMGGTAQIQASRTAVAGGFGHISMNFFRLGSGQNVSEAIFHTLIIFTVALLPHMIWRLRHHYARST